MSKNRKAMERRRHAKIERSHKSRAKHKAEIQAHKLAEHKKAVLLLKQQQSILATNPTTQITRTKTAEEEAEMKEILNTVLKSTLPGISPVSGGNIINPNGALSEIANKSSAIIQPEQSK